MFRRASLGIKLAGFVGVAIILLLGFKYIKWILILLGLKLLLEVFWKGYKNRKPTNIRFNPGEIVQKMRLGAVRGGERFAEGVDVPRPAMSKVMLFAVGGLVLIIGGVIIFKALSGIFKLLKPILLILVVVLIFMLVAKAKRGRPVTLSKVARHARKFSNRKGPSVDSRDPQDFRREQHPDYYARDNYDGYERNSDYYRERDPYRERETYRTRDTYREQDRRPRSRCKYGRDCREYEECRGEYECIYDRRPQRNNRDRVSTEERNRRTERMHVGR